MGPRSKDRGNALRLCVERLLPIASMGPRSKDRGNVGGGIDQAAQELLQWGRDPRIAEISFPLLSSPLPYGFNGAAIQGSRKWVSPARTIRASCCFNGAAIQGSRKSAFAARHWVHRQQLQWGRDPRIAEIIGGLKLKAQIDRFNGAAIQGSRKCFVASACAPEFLCFNGAAIQGSRKYTCECAELDALAASMGPRSKDRGNTVRSSRVPSHCAALQWGRDPRIAEIDWVVYAAGSDFRASMGPRSKDRGNGGCPECEPCRFVASMGPRSKDRGN